MTIKRRQVFYLAGFDHRGAAHYHSLYQNHAALQSKNTHYQLQVSDPHATGMHQMTWQIDYQDAQGQCQTDYSYLVLDDIVAAEMKPLGWSLYQSALFAYCQYVRSGFIAKARQQTGSFALSMISTYSIVIASPILAAMILGFTLAGILSWWLGLMMFGILWAAVYFLNQKINFMWLLHAYNFNIRHVHDESLFGQRLDQFADTIKTAISSGLYDEVMVVGHCYGSAMLIPLMARVTEQASDQWPQTQLSVLSLAQTAPGISWLPQAAWYRRYMQQLDLSKLTWVDFSSPADGVCFPKLDVFASSGIEKKHKPILKSPRFFKLFDANEYQRIIRKNKFRLHFQYLLSSQLTQEYDFFVMTAGRHSLAEQFAERAPSAVMNHV